MNLDILEANKDEEASLEIERLKAELAEVKKAAEKSEQANELSPKKF